MKRHGPRRTPSFPTRPAVAFLCAALLPASVMQAQKPPKAARSRAVKLKQEHLEDGHLLPIAARHEIADQLPVGLVGKGHRVTRDREYLRVDTTGDGKCDKRVSPRRSSVLELGDGTSAKAVVVFQVLDKWYCGSASCLSGRAGRRAMLTLLDADLDGKFDGAKDYARFGKGSFHRQDRLRWVSTDDRIFHYALGRDASQVELSPVVKPDRFNDLQWQALLAANRFRTAIGLPPAQLDPDRCDGCQKHAHYLYLNNYQASRSGKRGYLEVRGRPGYTEEGARAAQANSTYTSPDAARAMSDLSRTMLHRFWLLGNPSPGIGAGAVEQSKNSQVTGYAVVGGSTPEIGAVADIVVVPAPGQVGVPLNCKAENPRPDHHQNLYDQPRGFPVSVTFGRVPLTGFSIELFEGRKLRPVDGKSFSPEQPVCARDPRSLFSAFFLTDKPLSPDCTYTVRFRARHDGKLLEIAWQFRT